MGKRKLVRRANKTIMSIWEKMSRYCLTFQINIQKDCSLILLVDKISPLKFLFEALKSDPQNRPPYLILIK